MANTEPFSLLTGPWDVYIAPNDGTAESKPDVDDAPAGNWVALGNTNGEQDFEHGGPLIKHYDNNHQGPVKTSRPQEDPMFTCTISSLTLENYGYILADVDDVVTAAGPPAIKSLNIKRGECPTEYSLLLRGEASSPYGNFPSQVYLPKVVQASEPTQSRSKGGSPELECEFVIIEDDDQSAGQELGWMEAQTA